MLAGSPRIVGISGSGNGHLVLYITPMMDEKNTACIYVTSEYAFVGSIKEAYKVCL